MPSQGRRSPKRTNSSLDPTTIPFRLANAVTTAGSGGVGVLLKMVIAVVLWRYRRDLPGEVTVLAAGVLGGAGELVAMAVVAHPRPATAGLLGESGFGFASGHTTGFTAVAVTIAIVAGALYSRPTRVRERTTPRDRGTKADSILDSGRPLMPLSRRSIRRGGR